MAITYTVGTNTIQATGYTEATPCNFTDIYNADKAGTLSLHDRNSISAVDGAAVAVDRALKPTDYVILGGSSGDLYITVTNWTNMTTATIRITGTDRDDNAQTEDIVLNANGTYNTTKWFKTVTHTQVTVFTKSDSGSFDYELIQGQWGVVSRQCSRQYCFDACLKIGDGSIVTWFADEGQSIVFADDIDVTWTKFCISGELNSHIRLGKLIDASKKITSSGVNIDFGNNTASMGRNGALNQQAPDVDLYSCCFRGNDAGIQTMFAIDGVNYNFVGERILPYMCDMNWYNIYMSRPEAVLFGNCWAYPEGSFDTIFIKNYVYAIYLGSTGSGTRTFKNVTIKGNTYIARFESSTYTLNLINADVDNWALLWQGGSGSARLWRKYEFDLKVQDKDGNAINGATVKIWDLDNNLVVDTTTNASGIITTQTLNYGYYRQTLGNTPTMQTPHTIQISKVGYETYKKKWTIDDKTDWTIALCTPKRRFDSLEG